MGLMVPNEGEAVWLGVALGKTAVEGLTLRLFSNNLTLADTNTLASFTELSGSGYAGVALTAANWVLTEGAPANAAYPEVVFTFTGAAGDVYGYYLTGNTTNKVRWAERFTTAPYVVEASGDQIKVTLNVTLQDLLD